MQTMIRQRPAGLVAALLAVLVLTACAGAMGEPPPPAGEARTLEHQGIERHYYLHNIEATASAPVPLVVSLHGYRGTEQALTERNDLGSIRESYVFVIDCPERQEVGLWTSKVSRCGFRRCAG